MIWKDFLKEKQSEIFEGTDGILHCNANYKDWGKITGANISTIHLKEYFLSCVLETEKEIQGYLRIIDDFKKEGTPIDYEVNKLSELRGVLSVYKELSEGIL